MKYWFKFDIYIILFLSFLVRLVSLNQSLWLDEAINVLAAKENTFLDFITKYPVGDFHPPGYFILLWLWTHLFGFTETVVRLPSVFLGVCSVYLAFLIGKELINRRVGILAAIFMMVSPLHIYYSQEARMYSLSVMSVTLSFYLLIKILKNQPLFWWSYGFSVALVILSDYVAILTLPVHLIVAYFYNRQKFKPILTGLVLGGLVNLSWFGLFLAQIQTGIQASNQLPGWSSIVGGTSLKQIALIPVKTWIGRISIDSKILYFIVISLIGLINLIAFKSLLVKIDKKICLLAAWLILPILFAFMISLQIPILSYFRVIFVLPAYYILLALGVSHLKPQLGKYVLSTLILVGVACTGVYLSNPKFHREDWRTLVNFVNRGEDVIVIFEDNNIPSPFRYYDQGRLEKVAGLASVPASLTTDLVSLNLSGSKVYLVDYLVEINDPKRLIQQELQWQGYKNTRTDNFNGVGFVREFDLITKL